MKQALDIISGTSSAIVFQAGTAAGDQSMESIMTARQNQNDQNQSSQNQNNKNNQSNQNKQNR